MHPHYKKWNEMKKAIYLYMTLCLLTILTGCGGGQMPRELQAVSSIINQHPDSALAMLDSMEAEKAHWNKDAQMRYELLRLKAQNKLYIDFPNDSLPRVLVDYFDSHGSRNDRVLARYILGRAYHAMGDAPMALETYYDAISLADTLSPDCDLDALRGVYGQMSQIFHQQNLPHDELRALEQHIRITQLICSEEEAIIAKGHLIRPYFLMDSLDLFLQTINDCYRDLKRIGNKKMAAATVGTAITIYTMRGQLDKARELTDIYERESGLFDEQGNIAAGRESYYYCKGFFLQAIHETDSAEYYYRKAIRYGYLSEGYKGLLHVYRERHNADSMAYYSLLFEQAQDSLHNRMRTEAIHQMSALYDYSRSQKQAEQEAAKASRNRWLAICVAIVAAILLGGFFLYYRYNAKRKMQKIAALERDLNIAKTTRTKIVEELEQLKAHNYESVIAYKESQLTELSETIERLQAENEAFKEGVIIRETDNLEKFLNSDIAHLFIKKATEKTEKVEPTEAEWKLLISQFSKDNPATYKTFGSGKSLSKLEQRICILLVLDIPEYVISIMTKSSASTVSNSKARSNEKLFGKKDAHPLKINLIHALKAI